MSIALQLDFVHSETLDGRITAAGGANGTRVNSSGLIVAATCPRYDYDPATLAAKGLLSEEARTNLAIRSAQLDQWDTAHNASVTADQYTAPDGTSSMDRITASAGTSLHYIQPVAVIAVTAQAYTFSCYLRYDNNRWAQLWFTDTAADFVASFDLLNGVVGAKSANVTASSIEATNQANVYRCIMTFTPIATASGIPYIALANASSTAGTSFNAAGTEKIGAWGAQLEAGAFATSYIPTAGASVTRTADILSMRGSNFSSWFNQTEGTFLAEYRLKDLSAQRSVVQAVIGGGGNDTYHRILPYNGGLNGKTIIGGVAQCDFTPAAPSVGANHKTAFAYKTNDFGMVTDGGAVSTDTSGTGNPAVDTLYIGVEYGTQFWLNGHIRRLVYDNTRRSDADLVTLTGTALATGTASITEGGDTVSAAGQVKVQGNASITEGEDSASGAGEVGAHLVTPAGRIASPAV